MDDIDDIIGILNADDRVGKKGKRKEAVGGRDSTVN